MSEFYDDATVEHVAKTLGTVRSLRAGLAFGAPDEAAYKQIVADCTRAALGALATAPGWTPEAQIDFTGPQMETGTTSYRIVGPWVKEVGSDD